MRTSRYEIFLKAAEVGSLTQAAKYFNYTQSAVSQTIKHMEEEIGVELLTRKNRRIALTKDGEYLLPAMKEIAAGERALEDRASEIQKLQTGTIRMGTFTSMSCHWLPQYLNEFSGEYPNVRFDMRQGDYFQLADWLGSGAVDVAFMMKPVHDEFAFKKLFEDQLFVIVPEGHRLAERKKVSVRDIAREKLILPESDYQQTLRQMFRENGMDPDVVFFVKEDYTIMSMVENRLGISILPEMVLQRCPWKIKMLPMKKEFHRELGILTRKNETPPWAVRKFIEFVS